MVAASTFFISETNASAHRSAASEAAWDARDQGAQDAADMRDSGYNSTSVLANCVNSDYTGSNYQDYKSGCIGVVFQMQDRGR